MVQTVGQLLPLAACVALSSVPIIVTITLLLEPRSVASSLAFLIGWVIGMFLVLSLIVLAVSVAPGLSLPISGPVVGWLEVLVGAALLIYGIVIFAHHGTVRPQAELPRWLRTIGTVPPLPAFGLALALCLRPKALLVSVAAALVLAAGELGFTADLLVLVIFVAIGSSTVLVPVIVSIARPEAAREPLERAERWISTNSRAVTMVVVLLTGVVIVGHGMTDL